MTKMSEAIKTKIISFNHNNNPNSSKQMFEALEVADTEYKDSIFTNTTSRVPHVTKSLNEITLIQPSSETEFKEIANVNKNFSSFTKFYLRELKHYQYIVVF